MKYEYLVRWLQDVNLEEELTSMGDLGWEVIEVLDSNNIDYPKFRFLFKRGYDAI